MSEEQLELLSDDELIELITNFYTWKKIKQQALHHLLQRVYGRGLESQSFDGRE